MREILIIKRVNILCKKYVNSSKQSFIYNMHKRVLFFFSNMLIFNGMFYDLFDKKRTIYISNRSLFKNIIKDYFKLFYNY